MKLYSIELIHLNIRVLKIMNNDNSNKFIKLFEDIFFKNLAESERLVLTDREKIINIIANTGGILGFIIAYVIMIMRNSKINIPIFRDVVILDIKAELVLSNPTITAERRDLDLERWHLPSLGILIELIGAYHSYKRRARQNKIDGGSKTLSSNTPSGLNDGSDEKLQCLNEGVSISSRYLFYLLHFYIHKSIMLNNSRKIVLNVKSVVTINEFTPHILGYLSALYDMKIPLTLYMPTRVVEGQMPHSSLSMFSTIVARNGIDADFIETRYALPVKLEKTYKRLIELDSSKHPRVGVFLASYYTMETKQLLEFILNFIIPFLKSIQRKWNAKSITVSCHPSDLRSLSIFLENHVVALNISRAKSKRRMLGYDVVICGNSSVVEEALSEGIPVVYTGSTDKYGFDLFRYVEDGIVLDATKSIPTLDEVKNFYKNSVNKSQHFINGSSKYEVIDLIDAITNRHGK